MLLTLLTLAGAITRVPRRLMLISILTPCLLAEGFRMLAAPSPFADAWRLAIGVAMTLTMAPLFAASAQYLLTVAMVWFVLGHDALIEMPGGVDNRWSALLMGLTVLLGTVLNLGYVRVLRGSYQLRLELETLAYQDPLTGIDNRRRLLARLYMLRDLGRMLQRVAHGMRWVGWGRRIRHRAGLGRLGHGAGPGKGPAGRRARGAGRPRLQH